MHIVCLVVMRILLRNILGNMHEKNTKTSRVLGQLCRGQSHSKIPVQVSLLVTGAWE